MNLWKAMNNYRDNFINRFLSFTTSFRPALLIFLFLSCWFSAVGQVNKSSDEAAFRKLLGNFKIMVAHKDLEKAALMMHFPFFTAKFTKENGDELPVDPISNTEFQTYKSDIFNEEVLRILPKLNESSLSEIRGNEDTYYAALRKVSDPGSKLYEVYAEYKQQGRNTESFFAFTFGRVKGSYKVIAYYGKWPLR